METARRTSPAVARNAGPIIDVLRRVLPPQGFVLELASGSGEHALHFARAFGGLTFQPTDPDPAAVASIAAWREAEALPNLLPPRQLDATQVEWDVASADAILCINMVHISPWSATVGLMRGAAALLRSGGLLYLYGPYRRAGVPTAESNEAFDASLRSRSPEWGLRDLDQVAEEAAGRGLRLAEVVGMPANNLSLIFRLEL